MNWQLWLHWKPANPLATPLSKYQSPLIICHGLLEMPAVTYEIRTGRQDCCCSTCLLMSSINLLESSVLSVPGTIQSSLQWALLLMPLPPVTLLYLSRVNTHPG